MKRALVIGIVLIMTVLGFAQLVQGGDKDIDMDVFTEVKAGDFQNSTAPVVNIGSSKYNSSTNIMIFNNASYSDISFKVRGMDNGTGSYPSNVRLDLGDNGRSEYRFEGTGVGKMGFQENAFNKNMQSPALTQSVFPTTTGENIYLKLPSKALVTSAELNLTHPDEAIIKNIILDGSSVADAGYSSFYSYFYNYNYYSPSSTYTYSYYNYYPKIYMTYVNMGPIMTASVRSSYYYNLNPPVYPNYGYGSGYPDIRFYYKLNMNHPDLQIPPGAQILQYNLNYPLYRYHYGSNSYGYSWLPSGDYRQTYRYYAGEQNWGVFPLTSGFPTSFSYTYSSGGNIIYQYQSGSTIWEYTTIKPRSGYKDYYLKYLPTNITNPYATATSPEDWHTSTYNNDYRMSFDLRSLAEEWASGTLTNNGFMVTNYQTPYTRQPHWDLAYVQYNKNQISSQRWDKNNHMFYYSGTPVSPFTTSSTYRPLRPTINLNWKADSTNPWMDIGIDGANEWSYSGKFANSTIVSGLPIQNSINNYLRTHLPDEVDSYGNSFTYVPVRLGADTSGKIVVSDIKVKYDYDAIVHYNPTKGNLLEELRSLVPSNELGWTLLPINITSATQGAVMLKDLVLKGTKSNYKPFPLNIDDITLEEGVMDDKVLCVSEQFYDLDQPSETLQYIIQQNSEPDHLDLYLTMDEMSGKTYLGIDTSKDENWYGEVFVQLSATDEFGKAGWSNVFRLNITPVNDYPYLSQELPPMVEDEGKDFLSVIYTAPTGRDIASGKLSFMVSDLGKPYFSDIEGDPIHMDFELLGADMAPVTLERVNEDGYKLYRGTNNDVYLTVLPPEYTEDPDNFMLIIGSEPDYSASPDDQYYLRIYISDDIDSMKNQTVFVIPLQIGAVNDPPIIRTIPDIAFDEDTEYLGSVDFIETYITDVDNALEELTLTFTPSDQRVSVWLDEEGLLNAKADKDFFGFVPIELKVSDGDYEITSTFNTRIKSVNDPPVMVVSNLFDGKTINQMFFIRGTANDVEKGLRWIEVAIVKEGEPIYGDDWVQAEGAYVWQYQIDIREYEDGWYTINLRAYDGRDYSETLVFKVKMETPKPAPLSPPPVVTIITELTGPQSEKVTIEGEATDESGYVEFVEYRLDGGIWRRATVEGGAWEAVIDTRVLTNDGHNFSVRAYDGKSYSALEFIEIPVFNMDSDMDGIGNQVESDLGMDPFNKNDGRMDFDSDGFLNYEEIREGTDPFDGNERPEVKDDEPMIEPWALLFIAVAVIFTVLIIGLFLLNIRMERNMHKWREDLSTKRMSRKPKTLLQKIVELAPIYASMPAAPMAGPALPGGAKVEEREALPPMKDS